MIIESIRLVIGLVLALFLPGYLIVKIFFRELNVWEKIAFTVTFSVMIDIFIAVFLGYNKSQAARTGGLNYMNIMIMELIVLSALLMILGIQFLRTNKFTIRLITEEYDMTPQEEDSEAPIEEQKRLPETEKKAPEPIKEKPVQKAAVAAKKVEPLKERKSWKPEFLEKKPGLVQFGIRAAIFLLILFGFQMFLHLYFSHTAFFVRYLQLPQDFYFDFLTGLRKTDFINSGLFMLAIFVIWNRELLFSLKKYKRNWPQTFIFGFFAVFAQIGHYVFKYWIQSNMDELLQYSFALTIAKYLFNLYFLVFLALAVFNIRFFIDHWFKFKRQIPLFAGILVGYFLLIQLFQHLWRVLGNFVAKSIFFFINLTFSDAYLRIVPDRAPVLGIGKFIVGISEECSGIDSLLLFISLYSVIFALDYKRINIKRMLILFIPGIIGTVLYNMVRIYLLLLVGIYYSPEFAVNMFHSNAGWILFLIFFMIFWHFGSKWVYKKKPVIRVKKKK